MNFQHLTVRAKLTMAFGLLAGLVLLVSALAVQSLSAANDRVAEYVSGINARAALAEQVRAAVDRRAIAARNLVLVTTAFASVESAVNVHACQFQPGSQAHMPVMSAEKSADWPAATTRSVFKTGVLPGSPAM